MRRGRHLPLLLLLVAPAAAAQGELPAVPAGGLVLPAGLAVVRQQLRVRSDRVELDYRLLNEGGADLVAELAFVVPDYRYQRSTGGYRAPERFEAWVAGRRVPAASTARALLVREGQPEVDVTRAVQAAGLDVAQLGGVTEGVEVQGDGRQRPAEGRAPLSRLPEPERRALLSRGILAADGGAVVPAWTVRARHAWLQRFPARAAVEVRIRYAPAAGLDSGASPEVLARACAGPRVRALGSEQVVVTVALAQAGGAPARPAGELELVVEPPHGAAASLCWRGSARETVGAPLVIRERQAVAPDALVHFFLPWER
ncbi:MAG: DUF4424 family protein [Anaeromyxobacter sp.]